MGSDSAPGRKSSTGLILAIGGGALGCLLVLATIAIAGILYGLGASTRHTVEMFTNFEKVEPTVRSVAEVASHREIVEAFGGKIEPTGYPTGTSQPLPGGAGGSRSDYVIPIKGPTGTGKIHSVMSFEPGKIVFEKLSVTQDATGRTWLLHP